jgi:hypothetical protein
MGTASEIEDLFYHEACKLSCEKSHSILYLNSVSAEPPVQKANIDRPYSGLGN